MLLKDYSGSGLRKGEKGWRETEAGTVAPRPAITIAWMQPVAGDSRGGRMEIYPERESARTGDALKRV